MWKVYQIKTIDEKNYIGVTSMSMNSRLSVHKYQKPEMFSKISDVLIVLETESYDEASQKEAQLIKELNSTDPNFGYNKRFGDSRHGFPDYVLKKISKTIKDSGITKGEKNGMFGRKHTEESKKIISDCTKRRHPSTFDKNRIKTQEQLNKLFEGRSAYILKTGGSMKGKKLSESAKKKISDSKKGKTPWLGRKHSDETKKKMSEVAKLRLKNKIILSQ